LREVPLDDACHDLDPPVETGDHQPITHDYGDGALGGSVSSTLSWHDLPSAPLPTMAVVAPGHDGQRQADRKRGDGRDDHTLFA